jgi:hypothetical protein
VFLDATMEFAQPFESGKTDETTNDIDSLLLIYDLTGRLLQN